MFNSAYEVRERRKGLPTGISSSLENLHRFDEAEAALSFIANEVLARNARPANQEILNLALLKIAPKERSGILQAMADVIDTNHPNAERCSHALDFIELEMDGNEGWDASTRPFYVSSSYYNLLLRRAEKNYGI